MATVNPGKSTRIGVRRRSLRIALAILLVLVGLAAWFSAALAERATAGASYGARVACSCRFVANRSLENCERDFLPGMGLVMLEEDASAKSVTASVPLLARQTATWREGPGCVLQQWSD